MERNGKKNLIIETINQAEAQQTLVFGEKGTEPEDLRKTLSEQSKEPTNSTRVQRRTRDIAVESEHSHH